MEAYTHFADYYDLLMEETDYDRWTDYVEALFERRGVPVETVLDLACGTGNMTCRLAERGYRCTGVDRSEAMLVRAREKAADRGLAVPFLLQDMGDLAWGKPVDAVLCLCDGINYMTDKGQVQTLFKRVAGLVGRAGVFIFDISSAYKLEHILGNHVFAENHPEVSFIWENTYNRRKKQVEMLLTLFGKEGDLYRKYEEVHVQRAYETEELMEMLARAGFDRCRVYETLTFDEPVAVSDRLTFECEI